MAIIRPPDRQAASRLRSEVFNLHFLAFRRFKFLVVCCWQLGPLGFGLLGIWADWALGCLGFGLLGLWATWALGYLGIGLWATWAFGFIELLACWASSSFQVLPGMARNGLE